MFGSLRSLVRYAWNTQRFRRSLDPNWDLNEGERLLEIKNYVSAEKHLSLLATDAQLRGQSAAKRVLIGLLLAEAQRKQFRPNEVSPDYSKLEAAELTARATTDLAARIGAIARLGCLDALADILNDQGKFDDAEKVIQDAILIESSIRHPEPQRMALWVHRLGMVCQKAGRFDEAIPALEKALAIHQQVYGEYHVETANQLTALGAVQRAQGNHQEAQRCLGRALKIHQRTCGADSPEALGDLHQLAGSLEESGNLKGAAAQYERVLDFKHRAIGADQNQLASAQFQLAGLHINWQNYARARELLLEAIGTFKRKGGVQLATGQEMLAYVEECSGRYADAVKELERAGKVWEMLKSERLPELIRNLEHRVELLQILRRKREAAWLLDKISHLTLSQAVENGEKIPTV